MKNISFKHFSKYAPLLRVRSKRFSDGVLRKSFKTRMLLWLRGLATALVAKIDGKLVSHKFIIDN